MLPVRPSFAKLPAPIPRILGFKLTLGAALGKALRPLLSHGFLEPLRRPFPGGTTLPDPIGIVRSQFSVLESCGSTKRAEEVASRRDVIA